MKSKILLILGFLFAMWLGGKLNALIFAPDVGVVVLSNESSGIITSAEIIVCGQTFNFSSIPKGEHAFARYDVTAESHYEIKVSLQPGQTLNSEIGYVSHSADFFDVIAVKDDQIEHKSREVSSRY